MDGAIRLPYILFVSLYYCLSLFMKTNDLCSVSFMASFLSYSLHRYFSCILKTHFCDWFIDLLNNLMPNIYYLYVIIISCLFPCMKTNRLCSDWKDQGHEWIRIWKTIVSFVSLPLISNSTVNTIKDIVVHSLWKIFIVIKKDIVIVKKKFEKFRGLFKGLFVEGIREYINRRQLYLKRKSSIRYKISWQYQI